MARIRNPPSDGFGGNCGSLLVLRPLYERLGMSPFATHAEETHHADPKNDGVQFIPRHKRKPQAITTAPLL